MHALKRARVFPEINFLLAAQASRYHGIVRQPTWSAGGVGDRVLYVRVDQQRLLQTRRVYAVW